MIEIIINVTIFSILGIWILYKFISFYCERWWDLEVYYSENSTISKLSSRDTHLDTSSIVTE